MDDQNTKYETGVWYGWNGGECPVHPKTVVDYVWFDKNFENELCGTIKGRVAKDRVGWSQVIKFRIVTPYVEPATKSPTLIFDPNIYNVWYDITTEMVHVQRMVEADE